MDIVEFFQLSSGKWFSQRTSHILDRKQSAVGKSDLLIDTLSQTDPDVITLCERYDISPTLVLCGIRATSTGTIEGITKKQVGSTILVAIADPAMPNQGKLLQTMSAPEPIPAVGHYSLGDDEALTLTIESPTIYLEERLWFASPNLRLRTSTLKQSGGFSMASFCSEIRMGVTAPPAN